MIVIKSKLYISKCENRYTTWWPEEAFDIVLYQLYKLQCSTTEKLVSSYIKNYRNFTCDDIDDVTFAGEFAMFQC